jgi:hypothetical protein
VRPTDLPDFGKSIGAGRLRLGVATPAQPQERDPLAVFHDMADVPGHPQGPCVPWALLAARALPDRGEARPWRAFTDEGKRLPRQVEHSQRTPHIRVPPADERALARSLQERADGIPGRTEAGGVRLAGQRRVAAGRGTGHGSRGVKPRSTQVKSRLTKAGISKVSFQAPTAVLRHRDSLLFATIHAS